MKWYGIVLYVLLFIVLSPLICVFLIFYCISLPFVLIYRRKSYRKSVYYKKFKIRYKKNIYNSFGYVFYNNAIENNIPINYVVQKSNHFEYFIYNQQVFIFPDFSYICFNKNTETYEVVYKKRNKETTYSLNEYLESKISLFEKKLDLTVKILLSRNLIKEKFIDFSTLPSSLFVVRNYYSCFNEENEKNLSIIPTNNMELYEMMKSNEKLGGHIEQDKGNQIIWTFDKVIYSISVDGDDGLISVSKNNALKSSITHWHPENYEIYNEICDIGEKGNILVIKTFLGSGCVLYMGKKDRCPYTKKKFHLAKYYFFESIK